MGHTENHGTTRRALIVSCVSLALLALLLTGCESRTEKQADEYTNSLCTDISGWQSQVETIAAGLTVSAPRQTARTKLNRARTATIGLVRRLRALPVPSSSGAEEAKHDVDLFVSDAESTVDAERSQFRSKALQTSCAIVVPSNAPASTSAG